MTSVVHSDDIPRRETLDERIVSDGYGFRDLGKGRVQNAVV